MLHGFYFLKLVFFLSTLLFTYTKGLKDNYGGLIGFLSQIPKLSCFNLIDLAEFLMHH